MKRLLALILAELMSVMPLFPQQVQVNPPATTLNGSSTYLVPIENFGAKGDGVTDDSAAFNNFCAAASTPNKTFTTLVLRGGATYIIATSGTKAITCDSANFLTIEVLTESGMVPPGASTNRARIQFTGTPSVSALSVINCQAFSMKSVELFYTAAGFNKPLLDLSGCKSTNLENDLFIGGGGSAVNASSLVKYSSTNCGVNYQIIRRSTFGNAVNGVDAGGMCLLYMENVDFGQAGTPLSGTNILNPGQGSIFIHPFFENIGAGNGLVMLDSTGVGCFGCIMIDPVVADLSGTNIAFKLGGSWIIIGGTWQTMPSATLFQMNSGAISSFVYVGNTQLGSVATAFSCDTALTNVLVAGNTPGTVTTWNGGTGPCFAAGTTTGRVTDNLGKELLPNLAAAGSCAAPYYTWAGSTNIGIALVSGLMEFSNGGNCFGGFDTVGLRMRINAVVGWSSFSGNPDGAVMDTGLSRDAPNVVDCGNGTQGNKSCTFNAAKLQPAGLTTVAGGVPALVYNTASGSVNANITTTTMVTAPATNANCPTNLTANCSVYEINWYIDVSAVGTSCTGSTTVVLNFLYTDPLGAGQQTVSTSTITIATNGNGTAGTLVANGSQIVVAKLSTTVQYSTTSFTAGTGCSPAPKYQVTPIVKQLS